MDPNAIYAKTDKGQQEVQSRAFGLPLRSRTLLIMVDGKATAGAIIERGKAAGNAAAYGAMQELESQGFIVAVAQPASGSSGLEDVRRFAIDQLLTLLGPSADVFTARIEAAADRAALFSELERCRQAISGAAGAARSERFWTGVQSRLDAASGTRRPAAAAGSSMPECSLASARRFAIEQMRALPGPHGPAFVERLESAADRGTLVTMLERCRNAVQVATSEEGAKRFWAGVETRLP